MNYFRMIDEFYKHICVNNINESYKNKNDGNIDEICSLDHIVVIDKTGNPIEVDPKTIVNVVNSALSYMERIYPQLYLFLNMYKIMYIPIWPAKVCNTMGVDPKNNLWINMNFVYRDCNMKPNNIFGILFHEMFHIFLKHSIRFDNKFDEKTKTDLKNTGLWGAAHHKANMAMDFEINASMVDDGIVSEDFFTKDIPGLYNKDYVGMTWEDIYDRYGDEEYRKWLERNGIKINEDEMKILEAIEKASKILKDPMATEKDKEKARKELQKTIDKILGTDSEEDIQDALEKISRTKLGDIGDIKEKMQKVIDDLYKNPSSMSDEQYDELMSDIDELSKEMEINASEISEEFDKDIEEVHKDIENMKSTFRNSMERMKNDKKMSKLDKEEIRDKIKDSLEDVMLSDIAKEKKEKRRKERDEKRALEKKEELKLNHPLKKLIKVFKNLMHLGEEPYDLVCKKSYDIMKDILNILESFTDKELSKITKDDTKVLKTLLVELKGSLFIDLKKLLDNKTILHKTESDLHKLLDVVFEVVTKTLLIHLPNPDIKDELKITDLNDSVIKLRMIGKILKTQKAWRASDEFKEGAKEMNAELSPLLKAKDFKTILMKLYEMGMITTEVIETFDEKSKKLYNELVREGKIK